MSDKQQQKQQQQSREIKPDRPEFRFAQISSPPSACLPPPESEVIDKASFFQKQAPQVSEEAKAPAAAKQDADSNGSNWSPKSVRPVPAFYPLERSSRFIEDDHIQVASRLSECLRVLSVQALYNDENATASLYTSENVEMHLSLWKTQSLSMGDGIVVELQRRKGCSMTFHRYARHILDAAMGELDFKGGEVSALYSKKAERMLKMQSSAATEQENAIIAIEIAHGLIMKDRMDARQLGLESLCLLTDPTKTGIQTAIIASRVVLLGTTQLQSSDDMIYDESVFQEVRDTILGLIQLKRIGEESAESADEDDGNNSDDEFDGHKAQEKEHLSLLHNLALAVLANALDVIENEDMDTEPEDTKPAAMPPSQIANTFMEGAQETTSKELLSTLISELGKASNKPHNACLSAKCLGSLCRASRKARKRAKELGAKTVVSTALDVGVRTHAKLETECKKVIKVLTLTNDNNDDDENDGQQQH
mmetsp:Transcript_11405/g.16255  ORF Transcript_11405/g.16255 Transcript_11405/m.16255 type:complete len:479 (+) Transcript_11405:172-1608(+)